MKISTITVTQDNHKFLDCLACTDCDKKLSYEHLNAIILKIEFKRYTILLCEKCRKKFRSIKLRKD